MLKTTKSTESIANHKKTKDKASGNSVVGNSVVDGNKIINQINSIKRKNYAKMTKSKILVKSKNLDFPPNSKNMEARSGFFTLEARLAFTKLRQAFMEASIPHHFDSEYHIQIETDVSGYTISEILS